MPSDTPISLGGINCWLFCDGCDESRCRYVHGGAEVRTDEFRLSVSDVERTASTTVYVRVAMVDDERPVALRQGRGQTEVDEGGSVVLMAANIAATDNDTNDADLVFSVIQSPQYGDIEVRVFQCSFLVSCNMLCSKRNTRLYTLALIYL